MRTALFLTTQKTGETMNSRTKIQSTLRQLCKCQRGSVAAIVGLAFIPMMMAAGLAVDYGMMVKKKGALQAAADAGSIAGARVLSVANFNPPEVISVAKSFATTLNAENSDSAISALVTTDGSTEVTVEVTEIWRPIFFHLFSDAITPVTARSTAKIVGTGKVCMLGLSVSDSETVHLTEDARLFAHDCGVFSNSTSPGGITTEPGAKLTASIVCSAGGVNEMSPGSIHVPATTDCPSLPDPLKNRPAPSFGGCDYNGTVIKGKNVSLSPGVYCGGMKITKGSHVQFQPGVYIIKGGKFTATDTTVIEGDNVGFYMTNGAAIDFTKDTTIRLTAPNHGPMAGLLVYENPQMPGQSHKITSNNARVLTGTIYLPRGELKIDAKKPVADQSAYTAVIAWSIKLKEGPELHLNAKYSGSNVPVPGNLDTVGTKIVLSN